jgi:Dolichyl-phosphate-mannose-protein mannosyltransferase
MSVDRAQGGLWRRPLPSFTAAGVAGALLLGALIVYRPGVVAIFVPAIAMLLLVLLVTRALTPASVLRRVLSWTLAAFGLHLAIGLIIQSDSHFISYFGGDAFTYSTGATGIYQHWVHGAPLPAGLPVGKTGFYYLLAALCVAFGIHPQAGIAVNAGLAALIVPILFDATRRHFGDAAARAAPVLATLVPGFLIWGSQLLREPGIYLMMAVALNCAVRLIDRASLGPIVLLVAAIALLFTFRADVALMTGAGLIVALMIGRRQLAGGLASGVGTLALILALVVGGGLGYSGYRFVTHTSLQQVNVVRLNSSLSAASGFLPEADVSSGRHAASYIPVGGAYFLLGPAPWQLHNVRQSLEVPDLLVWWFLLPSLWRGIREGWRRRGREILVYVLPALAVTVALTLLVANFGTVVRERMQVVILLIPLMSLGWSIRHPREPATPGVTTRRPTGRARAPAAAGG